MPDQPTDHLTASFAEAGEQTPSDAGGMLALGECIGQYQLLGILGEGGFGVVYEAEQSQPVRRRVALKIIKPGMDSRMVVARFEAERQALAVMDNPGIAKIYDGGMTSTEQGSRPYFVMEIVRGEPITRFCDSLRMSIDERCQLFIRVCEAVQHAHTKGVIHRDLKPSNVLVAFDRGTSTTPKPIPKVIDFGVAKALHQQLSDMTIYTDHGQMIGTLEYMSPEQAEMSGLDIDTRSDVYSLGVMLYELLTGLLPFDSKQLRAMSSLQIQRHICDVEPIRPSARVAAYAAQFPIEAAALSQERGTTIAAMPKLLRDDLDWIIMRCLSKERERRYTTPDDLARDLSRFLSDHPIEAGPESVRYRLKKFVVRQRVALSIAGVIAAVLMTAGGLVWSASQRASLWAGEMDRFYDELLQSRSIAFGSVRSADDDNRLDTELRSQFADDPQGEIAKRIELVIAANRAGDLARLEMHSRRSLELLSAIDQPLNTQWIDAHSGIGIALRRQGKPVPALEHIDKALEIAQRIDNTDKIWEQEYNRAIALRDARELTEAEASFRRVLEHRSEARGQADSSTLRVVASLADLLALADRADEGERIIRSGIEAAYSVDPVDRREVLRLKNSLGLVLVEQGKAQDAAILLEACLNEMQEAGMGDSHAATAVQHHLARAYMKLEEWQKAERLLWRAMNARVASAGQQDSFFLRLMTDRTRCLVNMGRTAEASAQLVVLQSEITYQLRWLTPDTVEWVQIQRLLVDLSELETRLGRRGLSQSDRSMGG